MQFKFVIFFLIAISDVSSDGNTQYFRYMDYKCCLLVWIKHFMLIVP